MARMVSVRIQTSKQSKGQAGHDFNGRPAYADADRKHLNKMIFGGSESDIKARIDAQSDSIINRFNKNASIKRELTTTPSERRKIGSWRKTTATHKTAIVTFSSEVRAEKDTLNRDDLDKCALNFFTDFCAKHKCELTYIVRHDDESSPHYHGMFTNVNEQSLKPLKLEKRHLSVLQDDAGQAFSSMGMVRGIKRNERLDIARANNPQEPGESNKLYNVRIYKLANVINRSVSQLHEDLPKEILEKKEIVWNLGYEITVGQEHIELLEGEKNTLEQHLGTLNNEIENQTAKVRKMVVLLKKADMKLEETDCKSVDVAAKIQKNIEIYKNRKQAALMEIAPLEKQVMELHKRVDTIKERGRIYMEANNKKVAEYASIGPNSYLEKLNLLEAQAKPNNEKMLRLEHENNQLREKLQFKDNDRLDMGMS